MMRAAKLGARMRSVMSARREALPGRGRGVRLRKARDEILEGAPRRRIVAELELARRDVEQGVRHYGAVGIIRDQRALRHDRRFEIAQRELRIAEPILRRWRERASRVGAHEPGEALHGSAVIATLEKIDRGIVPALLGG